MLDAAQQFGLTREEAWSTLNAALVGPRCGTTVTEYVDDIAGELARAVLAKQRRMLSRQSP